MIAEQSATARYQKRKDIELQYKLRKPSEEEKNAIFDMLPYSFERKIKLTMVDNLDRDKIEKKIKESGSSLKILFKGVSSEDLKNILNNGLNCSLSNGCGRYTSGNGIYLADDAVKALDYSSDGKTFLIVEVAGKWAESIKGTEMSFRKEVEELLDEGFDGIIARDSCTRNQDFNEYICVNDDCMNVIAIAKFQKA